MENERCCGHRHDHKGVVFEDVLLAARVDRHQAHVHLAGGRKLAEDHTGEVTIEAYTVMHNADGPELGLCALRTAEGARTWGRVTDVAAATAMITEEAIGRSGNLDADGTITLG